MWNDLQVYFRMLAQSITKNEEGQTTVEYALVIALVVAMAVTVFGFLTPFVADFFTKLNGIIDNTLP